MQGTDQRAYDRGVTVFSPDGRLYQVEYAREAVARGSPAVGVTTSDGVAFAARARTRSPLMDAESVEKLHDVDGRLGVASAGHVADARRLVDVGREVAQRERVRFGEAPDVPALARAVADFVQESTQTGGTRPFGAALLLGGVDETGPSLFEVDPSGTPTAWDATAVGNDADAVRDVLEAEFADDLDADRGVGLAIRALAGQADGPLTADDVAIALAGAERFEVFDRERRASAIEDADRSAS